MEIHLNEENVTFKMMRLDYESQMGYLLLTIICIAFID